MLVRTTRDSTPRDDTDVPENAEFWTEFNNVRRSISDELRHLLNSMLDVQVKGRASIDEVAAHPWLQGDMPTDDEYIAYMQERPAS